LVQVPVPAFTNSLAFVPVMVKYGFCSTSAAVPVFVMVMVSGELVVLMFWFPNAPGLGEKLKAACVPVPVKLSVALTVPFTVNVAVREPVALGVKVRFIVQELDAAIVPPLAHEPVPVFAKLAEFVPVIVKYGVART